MSEKDNADKAKEVRVEGCETADYADYRDKAADLICCMIASLRTAIADGRGMTDEVRGEAETLARATLVFGGHLMDELGLKYEADDVGAEDYAKSADEISNAVKVKYKGKLADEDEQAKLEKFIEKKVEEYGFERVAIEQYLHRQGREISDVHAIDGIEHCWAMICKYGKKHRRPEGILKDKDDDGIVSIELLNGWTVTEVFPYYYEGKENVNGDLVKMYVSYTPSAYAELREKMAEAKKHGMATETYLRSIKG